MTDVAIETNDREVLKQLEAIDGAVDMLASERRGMDGATLFTTVLVLAPAIVPAVVSIVKAQIEARKHVRVIVGGVEIRGVSEKTLMEILKKEQHKKLPK